MSNKITVLITSLILVSLVSLSFAERPPQKRGDMMIQELNLTEQQQVQVKAIMKEQRTTAKAWRKQHHQQTESKLSTVLNKEQMTKFKAMKEERKKNRQMRKKNKEKETL